MQLQKNVCASRPVRNSAKKLVVKAVQSSQQVASGKPTTYKNQLEALKSMSVVVADTGDVELVKKYKPRDCTTNPSLVLKAVQSGYSTHDILQDHAGAKGKYPSHDPKRPFAGVADALAVNLGAEMLKIVPGRVSTEVDAHLSYDTRATYDKALRLMELYSKKGVDPKRIYIKIASTWEGIEACRKLQKQGIDCNMTLLFSFAQAAACADAGAALISPFVGRILDWYKAKHGRDYAPAEDPGVLSVRRIYTYYKTHNYKTIVMAASFRNAGEIRELAGCDNITISPQLLGELEGCTDPLPRKLLPECRDTSMARLTMIRTTFNEMHGSDEMAVEKLKQGIDGFAADQAKLEDILAKAAQEMSHPGQH
mmetsp:Transcript_26344/g.67049  ORF Transcript_26344/g.67049 Transcript_26344/m.67049 type:complete len:367 (-) Transcript_26344:545-1645(-)|eukprot:CAMPEP_0202865724 /NCGR_PEP_ID=MMETSP1391-20130828/6319_1 /ASSEMBLY_ACC=CAM_ASM_000867 /TAXON_ID=1034604 /ORGANISM="Chlamydomonas leiostraca, Strain SAG 11-49" /LENGTH=366 /DNA_ID=CAMNT_0049545595 /DNA_START=54 /DNA_END=1154 /DNA_ORIENTATION=+